MATRVDKSKMTCNSPRKSPNPKKKKVVKACSGGQEKIIHYGASGYGHNYSAAFRYRLPLPESPTYVRSKTSRPL